MARRSKPIARHTQPARPAVTNPVPSYIGAYQGMQHGRPSSDKGQGMWRTVAQSYRTPATHDARWSATVGDQ